jgi:hypothetical protein
MAEAIRPRRAFLDLPRNGSLAQTGALVVGLSFMAVGVLGFIPGITTNFDDLAFAGHESDAELLGLFEVSVLHNIVHLVFGVAGVMLARTHVGARSFLVVGGLLYLGLWLYGMAIDRASDANFLPLNEADDWLHFGLGAAMVLLGALAWSPDRRLRGGDATGG